MRTGSEVKSRYRLESGPKSGKKKNFGPDSAKRKILDPDPAGFGSERTRSSLLTKQHCDHQRASTWKTQPGSEIQDPSSDIRSKI